MQLTSTQTQLQTQLETTIKNVFSDQNKATKISDFLKDFFSNHISQITTETRSSGDVKISIILESDTCSLQDGAAFVIPSKITCIAKESNVIDFENKDEAPYELDAICCGLATRKCTWWDLQVNRDSAEISLHHDLKILDLVPIGGTPIVKSMHLKNA